MTDTQVQELLKPRYKVIADFPYNHYGVGAILDRDWALYPDDDETQPAIWRISQFPHLFKRLEWWEERKADEMPQYLLMNHKNATVYKAAKHNVQATHGLGFETENGRVKSYCNYLPSTEEEYLSFVNQTNSK